MFKFGVENMESKTVLSFEGDLDIDVTELMEQEIAPLMMKQSRVEIDFSGVHFVDSSGIGLLISLVEKLRDVDTEVRIVRLNEDVKLVFGILQLPEILGPDVLADFIPNAQIG